MRSIFLITLCFITLNIWGQSNVELSTGMITMMELKDDTRSPDLPTFKGRQYGFVRFGSALTITQQNRLSDQDVHFITSTDGAYFLSFPISLPLEELSIKAQSYSAFPPMFKLSERLFDMTPEAGAVSVRLLHTGEHSLESIVTAIQNVGGVMTSDKLSKHHIVSVNIDLENVMTLANIASVLWVELKPAEEEALRYQAVKDERVNVLHSNDYGLKGEGIVVGVGDAGKIGNHIDLNGHITNYALGSVHFHATHVTGIIAGKPNLNPIYGSGVAPEATIVSSYFSNIITDAERHIEDHDMLITNNSYGSSLSDCDLMGDYDLSSVFVDAQLNTHDTLTHVFAAGNSGSLTCSPYPKRYATIATGWQCAKNTLVVGMTSNIDGLSGNSSRGPVDDGRLKPEIVAVGNGVNSTRHNNTYGGGGGTSYSSPAIAGITALLYERYIDINTARPSSALIKAIMLNTADDLGRPGPDYFFGYGRVNARQAVEVIDAQTYYEGEMTQGDSTVYSIEVPVGAAEVRVMVLWNDKFGVPFSSPALTNDIDLTLINPSLQSYMPWVLDPSASGVSQNAVRGRDSINNHEQVTIDNPEAGTYQVVVRAEDIPVGAQDYVVIYDIVMPGITVIHPNGYEALRAGSNDVIRWDAYGDAVGNYKVEYSYDGSEWVTLSSSVNASRRYFNWTIPDTFAEQSVIRLTSGAYADSSNYPIVVLDRPGSFTLTSPCATFAEMSWLAVDGAGYYNVYRYVDDEMLIIDTTSDLSYTVSGLGPNDTEWFSVAAVTSLDVVGVRIAAKSILISDDIQCVWDKDIRIAQITNLDNGRKNTSTELSATHSLSIQIINNGTDTASGFQIGYQLNDATPVVETFAGLILPGSAEEYTFSTVEDLSSAGSYAFHSWVSLIGDVNPENDSISKTFIQASNNAITLPWIENFEAAEEAEYQVDAFAFCGLEQWDYHLISGSGRCRSNAGNGFTLDGDRAITLDNIDYNNNAASAITATLNLANYDTATSDIRLNFSFMHHELTQDDDTHDLVWIRGSDTSVWIPFIDLFTLHGTAGELLEVNTEANISEALSDQGQNYSSSFQLRFGQEGNASADVPELQDGYTFDNIQLVAVGDDLQLISVINPPVSGCGLGLEVISVRLISASDQELEEILMSYSINGSPIVVEKIQVISSGADTVFSFSTPFDFTTEGKYELSVWLSQLEDTYHLNDSILGKSIFSYNEVNAYPYFEDFETGNGGWQSSGVFNSWQRGKPSAALIHKAASGKTAWVTNLEGDYNAYEVSYLTSPCFDLSGLTQPVLSFAHIYELENNYDFLWVEYSENGGAWTKLGAAGEGMSWYDDASRDVWDLINERWHVASIDLPVNASQVQFRFVLTSDVGLNLEGAGIDAIHVHEKAQVYSGPSATPISQAVSGTNWIHFNDPNGRLFSIHPMGQDLGSVDVSMFQYTGATRNDEEAYLFSRNWVVNSTVDAASPVKLRFYISETDVLSMYNAMGCSSCSVPEDAFESEMFKFSGTIEDSILSNNVTGDYQFFGADDRTVMPYDSGYIVEVSLIDFSEFWLTGSRVKFADSLVLEMGSTSDDAEEFIVSGGVDPYSDTLDLGESYIIGLRFPDAGIPQGAYVSDARIELTPMANQSTPSMVRITGEKVYEAAAFNTGNYNISQRNETEYDVVWHASEWNENDSIKTASIRAIIQEIVDQDTWQPGNALSLKLESDIHMNAFAYDADPSKAARLFIEYDSVCNLDNRLYVDGMAIGDNTGESWSDAFSDLQQALGLTSRCKEINEIWVAEGTYKPSDLIQSRSFEISGGVKLYGGFDGTETLLAQRDVSLNETILSGDIGQSLSQTDNAFHVVAIQESPDTATIDGITIVSGYAFGNVSEDQSGAGIRSVGNVILQNCIIEECASQHDGSAIFHSGNMMTLIISNCTLRNNTGTAIQNADSGSILILNDNLIQNND